MPQKKKQHYVSKFLLKNFANTVGRFYVFQLQKNIIIDKLIPYNQQCYTDYMYGDNQQWESELGVIESDAAVVIQKIIHNECLSDSDELIIKQFILFQYIRTEQVVDKSRVMIEDGLRHIIPVVAEYNKINNSQEFVNAFTKKYVSEHFSRRKVATSHLKRIKEHQFDLKDLRLAILRTSERFIISDNPVILENLFQPEYGRGYLCVGVFLILPISSEFAILLYDDKVYDISSTNLYINLDPSDTFAINRTLFFYARETLFCDDKVSLQKIKQHFDAICIDNPLREILYRLGVIDPIMANLRIEELKKSNSPLITKTVPKLCAPYEPLTLSILSVNSQFLPYVNYINGSFSRYDKPEELEWKYSSLNPAYWEVVKKYLS